MSLAPPIKWAQRQDRLFITFDLQDSKDPVLEVTNDEEAKAGRISFRAKAHSHATGPDEHVYAQDLELFDEIDPSDVKEARTDRTVTAVIAKKTLGEFWPRLLKAKGRPPQNIKVDWDRWADEDDEDVDENAGFDFSQLQGLQGGAGGFSGPGGFGGADGADLASLLGGSGGLGDLGVEEDDEDDDEDDGDEIDADEIGTVEGPPAVAAAAAEAPAEAKAEENDEEQAEEKKDE